MPFVIFFGVPTVLTVLASLRRSDDLLFGQRPVEIAPLVHPYIFGLYSFVEMVVGINRMRATGRPIRWLLVPGYNVYLLLLAPDQ